MMRAKKEAINGIGPDELVERNKITIWNGVLPHALVSSITRFSRFPITFADIFNFLFSPTCSAFQVGRIFLSFTSLVSPGGGGGAASAIITIIRHTMVHVQVNHRHKTQKNIVLHGVLFDAQQLKREINSCVTMVSLLLSLKENA